MAWANIVSDQIRVAQSWYGKKRVGEMTVMRADGGCSWSLG